MFLDQKIYTIGLLKDKNDIPGVQNYTNGWLVILPTYVDLEKKDAILKFLKSIFTALNVDIENTLVLEEDFVNLFVNKWLEQKTHQRFNGVCGNRDKFFRVAILAMPLSVFCPCRR